MADNEDRCVHPRNGQDSEDRPYPDRNGTMLDEMFWLRSFNNKTYLWNDEVTDKDPDEYDTPKTNFDAHYAGMQTYFNTLKTKEKSTSDPSKDKDQFHFMQTTKVYVENQNSAPDPSYGIEWYSPNNSLRSWNDFATARPREVRVRYTVPDSPVAKISGVKVKRGDRVKKINGSDFETTVISADVLNPLITSLLYPKDNQTTTFEFEDVDTGELKTVVVQAKSLRPKAVISTNVIPVEDDKKVGYINFTTFSTYSSEQEINDAIGEMKTAGVEDLVLDLRYNGGGFLYVAAQVGHMISGISIPTEGNPQPTFAKFRYNDDAGNTDPRNGRANTPVPFVNVCLGGDFSIPCFRDENFADNLPKLNTLNLKRVYILSSQSTCSASEAVINGLVGANIEVILIGDKTCGKPYGFVPEHNCGITYYTIQFQIRNDKEFGEYWDGLQPQNATYQYPARVKGCYVVDDHKKDLGSKEEVLLAAALKYRKDGKCPDLPPPPSPPPSPSGTSNADKLIASSIVGMRRSSGSVPAIEFPTEKWFDNNLDLTVPSGVEEYLEDLYEGD